MTDSDSDGGPMGGSVWVCTECGRQHQRHNPPCSRCGNHDLERRDLEAVDDPLSDVGTRWRDVFEPRYVAGYVAVAVLLVVLGLGFAGVYDLPGASSEPPPVDDVPGNGTDAGGHSLATVEDEFVTVASERRGDGAAALSRPEPLDAFATEYNRRMVAAAFGEGERPDRNRIADAYDLPCDGRPHVEPFRLTYASTERGSVAEFEDERAFASDLYDFWLKNGGGLAERDASAVGVDVHVVEGERVFVTVASC